MHMIKKVKRQHMEKEKISAIHVSDKESSIQTIKRTFTTQQQKDNPILKWAKELN